MAKRRTYTVMVHSDNGYGTIWVDTVNCRTKDGEDDIPHIEHEAMRKCALDWQRKDRCDQPDTNGLLCMAIARGNVQFVSFDDSHLGD